MMDECFTEDNCRNLERASPVAMYPMWITRRGRGFGRSLRCHLHAV